MAPGRLHISLSNVGLMADSPQSHDQATVLFLVPYGTSEADIQVEIEPTGNYLVAGVRGQPPTIKHELTWQLEPQRVRRLSARERTNSTTSTASTQSSYAFFAASLESGPVSDSEDASSPPGFSSPHLSSGDEGAFSRTGSSHPVSRSVSPGRALRSLTSSYSSLESLPSHRSGRLLTLHLEKQRSGIWPSLIAGPVPGTLSPEIANTVYNMDPTSLILIALELLDIRKHKEEAFEYFLRAWHQAHTPSATMKLVSHYLPLQATLDLAVELYLEAGMLHLEGAASAFLPRGTDAWQRDREAAGKYFERARLLQPSLDIPVLPPSGGLISRNPSEQLEMPSIDLYSSPEPVRRRRKMKEETTLFDNREAKLDDLEDNTWYLYVPGLVGVGTALLVMGVISALSFSTRRNQSS
ncbi:hypothetical protein B0H13DRAFT_1958319 [Mycena leptocephala]|nr:hypothetical protein B0H13DRAFT_1958319 [Mycena leptocephala]